MGDDADEHVGRVDHGDGEQVVLVDLAGDRFLVLVDPREDDVALHHVFDHGRPARQDQPLERDESDQPALVIDDVAVVDRFAVGGLVAQEIEGLADGDVRGQRHVVGRHGGAGGAGLIAGQAADILALGLGQERQHRVDHVFIEPVHQVGTLVVRHQMQQLGGVLGRHRLDELGLPVLFEVAQNLGAVARGQDVEDRVGVLGVEVVHQLGEPARGDARRRSRAGRRSLRRGSTRGGREPGADFAWALTGRVGGRGPSISDGRSRLCRRRDAGPRERRSGRRRAGSFPGSRSGPG